MQYGPSDQIVRAQFEHGIRDRNGLQNLPSRHATDPIFWHEARAKLSSKRSVAPAYGQPSCPVTTSVIRPHAGCFVYQNVGALSCEKWCMILGGENMATCRSSTLRHGRQCHQVHVLTQHSTCCCEVVQVLAELTSCKSLTSRCNVRLREIPSHHEHVACTRRVECSDAP